MTEKVLLLINPYSGNKSGEKTAGYIARQLAAKGYGCESKTSRSVDELHAHVKATDLSAYSFIGVIGGDGSMHEFINAAFSCHNALPVPVALFPCGTGNAFNFDIGCATVDETLECIFSGSTSYIDMAGVEYENRKLWSFNILGCGLVTEINALAEKMRFLGGSRYTVASLIKLVVNPVQHYRIKTESGEWEGRYSFILACNTRYTGKGMMMAPQAELNDGKFDVLLVEACPFWKLLKLFPKIFKGTHVGADILHYMQVNTLEVSSAEKRLITNIDGEIKGETPFRMNVVKDKVRCFVKR
ncbi:MAG: diacylglycerol kinase family lipid kinase [Bacteroidia bacterium]|nr:diacylglycerol kinase family lipid kinase [Bacteroidia bacterium]